MTALREAVESGGTAVLCQVLAGMGGVGKTQLAADHARHAWQHDQVELLVWATATTRQAVLDAYAQAGADVLGTDLADPQRAARAFLAWLEPKPGPRRCRWLIVLDDVAEPDDLDGLWPPANPHGRTLVTTRRRDAAWTRRGRLVQVGLFSADEAVAYLAAALAAVGRHEPAEQLAALAEELGYLPLALSQAAAYLADTYLDCAAYRSLLCSRTGQLHDLLPETSALPDEQTATVAAAWSLSLDRADLLRPVGLARPMLELVSMLAPNGIPQSVLTGQPALDHLTRQRDTARTEGSDSTAFQAVTDQDAVGALRALHRLSLIDHTPDAPPRPSAFTSSSNAPSAISSPPTSATSTRTLPPMPCSLPGPRSSATPPWPRPYAPTPPSWPARPRARCTAPIAMRCWTAPASASWRAVRSPPPLSTTATSSTPRITTSVPITATPSTPGTISPFFGGRRGMQWVRPLPSKNSCPPA